MTFKNNLMGWLRTLWNIILIMLLDSKYKNVIYIFDEALTIFYILFIVLYHIFIVVFIISIPFCLASFYIYYISMYIGYIDYSNFDEYLFIYISISIPFSAKVKTPHFTTYQVLENKSPIDDSAIFNVDTINWDFNYFITTRLDKLQSDFNNLEPLVLTKANADNFFTDLVRAILSLNTVKSIKRISVLNDILVRAYFKFEYHKYYVEECTFKLFNFNDSKWDLDIKFFAISNL